MIRRRRACESCAYRFSTFERIELAPLRVIKRSGRRELFDGEKIRSGLAASAKGCPISDDDVDALVDGVEDEARTLGLSEVSTEWVGLAVLDRLRTLDAVACLRFASVYKGFTDVGDFEREARLIKLDEGV